MSRLRERVVPVVSVLGRAVKVRRSRYRGWKPICGFEGSIPSRLTTFPSHPANNLRTRIVRTLTGIEPWSKLGRTAAPVTGGRRRDRLPLPMLSGRYLAAASSEWEAAASRAAASCGTW